MKKYLVINQMEYGTLKVAGQFDSEEDANNFARLSMIATPECKFWVFEQSK